MLGFLWPKIGASWPDMAIIWLSVGLSGWTGKGLSTKQAWKGFLELDRVEIYSAGKDRTEMIFLARNIFRCTDAKCRSFF
jgi:hypothetical protein